MAVLFFLIAAGFLFFENSDCVYASFIQIPKTGNSFLDLTFANPKLLTNPLSGGFESIFKLLFIGLLQFEKLLMGAAASLFIWIVDVNVFKNVVNGPDIYPVWQKVRDILNIAFILVLLYSAFCTILQIESYNYKKILLKLVIMALLVNFSFPITRFIIDTSNVLMYTLINTLIPNAGGGLFAKFSDNSQIQYMLSLDSSASWQTLIAAVVFLFILAITLLAIALLLVVRMVVLVIIIIFSPFAFVGSIISVGGSYSSKWWDNLFRYSFFGPIMIFMLYVASTLMDAAIKTGDPLIKAANANSASFNFIASMAYFSVPIVILWIGMGVAASMSGAAGSAVMGGAQRFIGKVGKYIGKGTYKAPWAAIKSTGIPGGVKQRYGEIKDKFKSAQSGREARVASALGSKSAEERDMRTRAEEYKKNKSLAEMQDLAKRGDAAAAYALADMKEMTADVYAAFSTASKNPRVKKALDTKVKQNRADLVATSKAIDHTSEEFQKVKTANPTWSNDMIEYQVMEDDIGKLTAEKWADQDWAGIAKMPPSPEKTKLISAAIDSFINLTPSAQGELAKRISPANRKALNSMGIVI